MSSPSRDTEYNATRLPWLPRLPWRVSLELDPVWTQLTRPHGVLGPVSLGGIWSGRRDLNPGPLAPQASALARLRHGPTPFDYSRCALFAYFEAATLAGGCFRLV